MTHDPWFMTHGRNLDICDDLRGTRVHHIMQPNFTSDLTDIFDKTQLASDWKCDSFTFSKFMIWLIYQVNWHKFIQPNVICKRWSWAITLRVGLATTPSTTRQFGKIRSASLSALRVMIWSKVSNRHNIKLNKFQKSI